VIIGAPTYEYKLFPPVASALNELGRKRITGKTAFRFGSYGWSGGAEKELAEIIERNNMKWNLSNPWSLKEHQRMKTLPEWRKECWSL